MIRTSLILLLGFIISLSPSILLAQSIDTRCLLGYGAEDYNKNYIEGSRYLYDDFIEGTVYMVDGTKISNIPLRYNLHNDEFQFKSNDSIFAVGTPYQISKIVMGNEEFIYLKANPYTEVSGYVKIWNEAYPALITKMETYYYKRKQGSAFGETLPKRFERQEDKHFLLFSQGKATQFSTVNDLIQLFDDHQPELAAFSKKEKISKNDPEELNKLVEYYQSLKQHNL
jgi:hypothetical protein